MFALLGNGYSQPAEVTIFNPDTIIDNATFEKPYQYATGVEYVIVNGNLPGQ